MESIMNLTCFEFYNNIIYFKANNWPYILCLNKSLTFGLFKLVMQYLCNSAWL